MLRYLWLALLAAALCAPAALHRPEVDVSSIYVGAIQDPNCAELCDFVCNDGGFDGCATCLPGPFPGTTTSCTDPASEFPVCIPAPGEVCEIAAERFCGFQKVYTDEICFSCDVLFESCEYEECVALL